MDATNFPHLKEKTVLDLIRHEISEIQVLDDKIVIYIRVKEPKSCEKGISLQKTT